jgi:hypothetical protein
MFGKRLILDGWPGVFYSLQRTYAELLLSLKLLDARLRGRTQQGGHSVEPETGKFPSHHDGVNGVEETLHVEATPTIG